MNRDFPDGPVVKNPPYNTGDLGLIPGQGTKIPYATGQLSPVPLNESPRACKLQSPRTTTRERKPTLLNEDPLCLNEDLTQPNK